MIPTIEEKINQLEQYFALMNTRMAGAVWPMIVDRWPGELHETETHYIYKYPLSYFQNKIHANQIYMPYEKKSDRIAIVKFLLDKLTAGSIDIPMYHFGLFSIYGGRESYRLEEDFSESAIGKRRAEYANTLPRAEYISNDDFVSSIYSYLIERRHTEVGRDYRRNPYFNEVRLLFTAEQFGAYSGLHYTDADWVEPISGKMDLECRKWVGEKDPMAPQPKKEGMIEGTIELGQEGSGSGYRHFVAGKPINAGSYMEVKFGDGWIAGRYEWSFEKNSPIRIHSSRGDWILITEGHLVRIRK
ncbi:hypothetical protein [Paenibacillus tyrfis]|uniref:hypothetical protein n=1 Tax=Paenibacillus tyrfis TaxID=1501230 RepID=UPI000B58DF67|nr:hypothetical protein [Paenibacillus tyrfis]